MKELWDERYQPAENAGTAQSGEALPRGESDLEQGAAAAAEELPDAVGLFDHEVVFGRRRERGVNGT